MTTKDRYFQINSIFHKALELDPGKRAPFLDEACGTDSELRREIEELLQASAEGQGFLSAPVLGAASAELLAVEPSEIVGSTLGPYPVISLLGAGGMGEVYRARDPRLSRDVAIKVLPAHLSSNTAAVARFEREARAVAALSHPNVLSIFDFGREKNVCYAVTELLEGETLHARLERTSISLEESLDIALSVAQGLAAAHARGIVHRDLKPENIFLTADGRVKILDFGLARFMATAEDAGGNIADVTQAGMLVGTFGYMSPEQVRCEQPGTASDVFAFGCVLYEMIAGRRAFARPTPAETSAAILKDPAPTFAEAGVAVPAGLETFLARCLEKAAADRYSDAQQLLADLESIREETSSGFSLFRFLGRRQAIAVILAVMIVLPLLIFLLRWLSAPRVVVAGFQERDWIVITDFENETGDEIFDRSLDSAFRISIAQSSYVNVLSPSRIDDSLRMIRQEPGTRINRSLGREIAQREGAKLILIPAITGLPGSYLLSSSFEDPLTGNTLHSDSVRVRRKEDVLDGVDQLARNSRQNLGESLEASSNRDMRLTKVTTSSLEALKQYSLGIESHRRVQLEKARVFYENALALDPGFTAAMASLGMIEYEHFNREKGKSLLSKAVNNIDGLTAKERYGILAFYARAVDNDLPKAIRELEAFLAMYPDDAVGHHNLGWFNSQLGNLNAAVDHYRQAIQLDPSLMFSYDNLNWIYLYDLGELSLASDLCRQQIQRNQDHDVAYINLGWAYLGKGDLDKASAAFEKALKLNPKSTFVIYRLANTYRLQKAFGKAVELLERIPQIDPTQSSHYELGIVYGLMGNVAESRRNFQLRRREVEKQILDNPKDPQARIFLALVNARLGRPSEADLPRADKESLGPREHCFIASFYSICGNADAAMAELELALQKGLRDYVWAKINPDLENLHQDARFQALFARLLK